MYVRHWDTSTRGAVGSVVFNAMRMDKTSMIIKYTYFKTGISIKVKIYPSDGRSEGHQKEVVKGKTKEALICFKYIIPHNASDCIILH